MSSRASTPAEPAIRVDGLHRWFDNLQAVRGVSFEIPRGSVVGFIGANGAGKTTTMRIMVTLDLPTMGSVEICGYDAVDYPSEVRRCIGWMPDHFGPYENMTVFEYLDLYARAYGLAGAARRKRVQDVMEFTDLDELRARHSDRLSKGMTQRLCLARALLSDPEVLVLDEPAAGLDPKARVEFKNLVGLLAESGKTLFISSHILSELGEMCDSLVFIDAGKVVHQGSAESLRFHGGGRQFVQIRVRAEAGRLRDALRRRPGAGVQDDLKDGAVAWVEGEGVDPPGELLEALMREGLKVYEFHRVEQKLEDAFIDLLRGIEDEERDLEGDGDGGGGRGEGRVP